VVEVEAAQEILVRLARAAMLGDDHSRDVFQHFAGAEQRAVVDELWRDHAGARGVAAANAVVVVAAYLDGIEFLDAVSQGDRRRRAGKQHRAGERLVHASTCEKSNLVNV
jgi:hypothetical protein